MSELADYPGHYAAGDTYLSVRLEESRLCGQLSRLPELPLCEAGPDAFRIVLENPEFEIGIAFRREEKGLVDGVVVTRKRNEKRNVGRKLHRDRQPLEGEYAVLEGRWRATLALPGVSRFHIGLELFANGAGAPDGFLSFPEQRAGYVPIDSLITDCDRLELRSDLIRSGFSGRLKLEGNQVTAIEGKWTHRGKTLKAAFRPVINRSDTRERAWSSR